MPGWLLPIGLAGAGTAVLLWRSPNAVLSGLTSWRAWAFVALAGAAAALLPLGVRALGGPGWLGRVAGILPIVAALTWAVLPAFHNTTVDEPLAVASSTAPSPALSPTPAGPGTASPLPSPVSQPPTAAIPSRSAALKGIGHRVTGRASLQQLPDGSFVVRLTGLDAEAGPDYHVYLVPGAAKQRPTGGLHLAKLKGNRGNQNYPVPTGTGTGGAQTVLIWCRAFSVPVAAATLG